MKKVYLLFAFLLVCGTGFSQDELSKEEKERREKNIEAGNPFARFGYKAKVATLSKGKYLEFHDLDSIVTIGSVRFNVYKNQIVGNIIQDTLNPDAQPIGDVTGRWMSPDPLSEEFPEWSPYTMVMDSPIRFNDPTGMAAEWTPDKNGNLIAEKGDNMQTLAKFLGVNENQIILTTKDGKPFDFKEGNVVTLDNNMTRSIENSDGVTYTEKINGSTKDFDRKNDDYICDQGTMMAVKGEEITSKNAKDNYTGYYAFFDSSNAGLKPAESFEGAKFGQAAAVIGGEHVVTYYGTSKDGTIYVYSKDGLLYKPEVKPLNTVIQQMNDRGMNTSTIKYYTKNETK
jgi:hypothetical protein